MSSVLAASPIAERPSVSHFGGMYEVSLQGEDERLRQRCEQEASRSWPGARVLVHPVDDKFRAAVYLAEDGVEPDASVEPSALHANPHDALEEVLRALQS